MLGSTTAPAPPHAAPASSRRDPTRAPLPPGPKCVDAIRWLLRFRHQEGPLEVLAQIGERYGDVALLNTPMQKLVIQWLIDPRATPSGPQLLEGLQSVLPAAFA
jgi:hypothetical protein